MYLDLDVGTPHEHRFQIFYVLLDAFRLVAVGPCDDDILSVALAEAVPFLIAEHIEVEHVEDFQLPLHCWRLVFMRRGRRLRMFELLLSHGRPIGPRGDREDCQETSDMAHSDLLCNPTVDGIA